MVEWQCVDCARGCGGMWIARMVLWGVDRMYWACSVVNQAVMVPPAITIKE